MFNELRKLSGIRKLSVIQKRLLTFLIACIGARLLLVLIVKNINKNYLPFLGYLGLLIAFGFIFNFINHKDKGSTFGQKAWWSFMRPVHAVFYLWFSCLAFKRSRDSYIPLLLDVLVGLMAFLNYHYHAGSFKI